MGKNSLLRVFVCLCSSLIFASMAWGFQPVYVMASGNMGGTYYSLGGIVAETVNQKVPGVRLAVLPSSGSGENVELMETGLCQFGLMDSYAVMAYEGKDLYYENPQTFLRGVMPLYPEVARVLVSKGSKISSVRDLEGKKVVLGRKGSGVLVTAQQILRFSGLGSDKVVPAYLGMGEGLLALKEGTVDAVIFVGPLGGGSAMEQEALKTSKVLGLDDAARGSLLGSAPYWREFSIPAGTFPNQDEEIKTVGAWTVLYCREDLNDDLVYRVAKTIYKEAADLSPYIPGSVTLRPGQVQEMLVPIHPGAARFFKEEGSL
ncbi:TAXI family TRAP transporter solute-binding subunit [Dethiosulfovibrio salsuginis]|uniref:TRAP transporter solute receptor, TAXI family n=1 Tax=Dethiosulfovibrio salsuginis TaxID=561720 RepID=A0A1X7JLC2_9BACT|nr:TAXI family TRAP transporter solute-binding subunit [Dethiosulfovibrio salsuginis]SMG28828.1 hypothetical protein SAMN06275492_11343 [Dethiosulfovibrio salsuginis]